MARTKHTEPSNSCYFHIMRIHNRLKAEQSALDELNFEGVSFRHSNRLRSVGNTPNPWDDKVCASAYEYHNKILHPKRDRVHYTKNLTY